MVGELRDEINNKKINVSLAISKEEKERGVFLVQGALKSQEDAISGFLGKYLSSLKEVAETITMEQGD